MRSYKLYITLLFLFFMYRGFSIDYQFSEVLSWGSVQHVDLRDGQSLMRPVFDGALYEELQNIPFFSKNYRIHTSSAEVSVGLLNPSYVKMNEVEQLALLPSKGKLKEVAPQATIIQLRKEPWVAISLIPIRWNEQFQYFEKLVAFDLIVTVNDIPQTKVFSAEYATNSVLEEGQWYKIKIQETGIYTVTYDDLAAMGFDLNVNASKIALFGNGGGMLPEKNDEPVHDDLVENPIQMFDGGDGSFDQGDYFLFYGQGPVVWKWNVFDQAFYHETNYYSDYAFYFITALSQQGKRIQSMDAPAGTPTVEVNDFIDYAYHEEDVRNLASIGRTWYGELYDLSSLSYDFIFSFPNIVKTSSSGFFAGSFASTAKSSNAFQIEINETLLKTLSMDLTTSSYDYGKEGYTSFRFLPKDDNVLVTTTYQRNSNTSVGYLNYIEVNVKRSLTMVNDQMAFRNVFSNPDQVASYSINNADNTMVVWDVSIPTEPQRIQTQEQGNALTYKTVTKDLNEFVIFGNTGYKTVEFVEKVENQNLHGIRNIDYLIVTHPDFVEQANVLANFHREHNQFNVEVVSIHQVYNEFSSGAQDVSAIRNFAKMLYQESDSGAELKYMLLFGDASYDYKDILQDNSNYVPCWESVKSLNIVSSIATDDYFGFLDDGEGVEGANSDRVDIGIGRFVVASVQEAEEAVEKTMHYSINTPTVMAPWRNVITFVADDGDGNQHMNDAEDLSDFLGTTEPVYNINKIYVDAYEQVSTPGGQKAPDVNQAINLQMEKGNLIFNYSGHGGEIGLGHEQIVQISDILSWTNYDKLAVFITATCEFTRYDDPSRISAGEQVFLNSKGGAIALFTTTRPTYAAANLALNMDIYDNNMFEKIAGEYPTFGDIIRQSKRRGSANDRKFILVGDPACRMVYPEYNVETTSINMNPISAVPDTLKALAMVSVQGRITEKSGEPISDFQGEIFPLVYDKLSEVLTYGDESSVKRFYVRKNVLFNGKASITNGEFSFEFMMPKDIAYKYGPGRISYYFRDEQTDGNGYFEDFVVGGFSPDAADDTLGPVIDLFMFDTTFTPASIVNRDPVLFAKVSDESGINTTGSGIGHDIVTMLDDNPNEAYVLNDYYEANENSFNSGTINYPFADLEEGDHVLSLKVWDVYNNSSVAYLPFVVMSSAHVIVENLSNFPNPFTQTTQFTFTHNQSGQELEVSIFLYGMDGALVRTLNTKMDAQGYQMDPLEWDGTTDNGGEIDPGFYVYQVVVRNADGQVGQDQSKLVFIK